MKFKKISLLASTFIVAIALTGCMGGGTKLPEGDLKVVTEPATGVVEVLLQSADYGNTQSTIASIVLPKDSKYELVLSMEKYIDGKLETTKEIAKYETSVIQEKTPIYFVGNAGKASQKHSPKTMYTFTEIDQEKTEDKDNPKYTFSKSYEDAIDFDRKVQVEPVGTDLNKEIPMIGYIKFKSDDTEKKSIDLNNYKNEVANYKEVNIITIKATKK